MTTAHQIHTTLGAKLIEQLAAIEHDVEAIVMRGR
jgi:hypothetical protein